LTTNSIALPTWLTDWMEANTIPLWGAADLRPFSTPLDPKGNQFPFAISFAIPMNPEIFGSIQQGPNQEYADEYARVNKRINELGTALAAEIHSRGFQASPLAASVRSDPVNIKGDFPHKTAATRAGLGWIGRHAQLITRPFGPWVRLGTVFTDMELPCGPSEENNYCGNCTKCVAACPAQALTGSKWYPGLAREEILDVQACDLWKKQHYYQFHKGHNCGICAAVCPFGQKVLKAVRG
jgi:epoxyqueuosine reductase